MDANDDAAELQAIERERAEQSRRKSLGVTSPLAVRPGRKSLGGSGRPGSGAGAGTATGASGLYAAADRAALDNTQVTALYSQCIQLSTANKITMQNTWNLKLIEYMDDVLKADDMHTGGADTETNFQKASCTLDASVKIYSYRVDSVHQNTYKMLGGLSRSGGQGDGDADEEEGEDLGAVVSKDTSKVERRVKRGGATLEANVAALNSKTVQGEFAVDPLFRKTSAAFDEAGARGMLLNNLSVIGACHLVFDSSDAVAQEEAALALSSSSSSSGDDAMDASAAIEIDVSELGAALGDFAQWSVLPICPLLATFQDMVRRLESGDHSSSVAASAPSAAAPLPGAAFASLHSTVAAAAAASSSSGFADGGGVDADALFGFADSGDADRAAAAERRLQRDLHDVDFDVDMDGGGGDDGNAYGGGEDDDDEAEYGTGAAKSIGSSAAGAGAMASAPRTFAAAMALVGQGAGDYSFFNRNVMRNWAGPDHWKFRAGASKSGAAGGSSAADAVGGAAAARARKAQRGEFLIDFTALPPAAGALMPKSRAVTTIQQQASGVGSGQQLHGGHPQVERHVLPEDLHFDAARLTALFLKPHLHLAPMARAHGGGWSAPSAANGEDAYVGYDYHNANDASFVSAHAPGADDEDEDEDGQGGDNMFGGGDGGDDDHDIDFDVDVAPFAVASASASASAAALAAAADGGELQLVAAPRAVSKIEIGYARAATKVDVKALKHGMWQQLSEEAAAAATKKRFSRPAGVGEPAAPAASELCSFQSTMTALTASLPADALPNISVSFCFICLLHLANEQDLALAHGDEGASAAGGAANALGDFRVLQNVKQ
jgi:condensin complex subunit 2